MSNKIATSRRVMLRIVGGFGAMAVLANYGENTTNTESHYSQRVIPSKTTSSPPASDARNIIVYP